MIGLPKPVEYRNQAVLNLAKDIAQCTFCRSRHIDGSIVAAHSNQSKHGKAGARKADDCFVAYLCYACHDAVDAARDDSCIATYIWEQAHKTSIPLFRHLLNDRAQRMVERGHS